ncbi:MAG: fibronectin type III domain-containing protein [Propionibacteriaceae bacterium]|jgi:hypothetical protein|nr:fibronectin type III domain-containing protein [Propionibacteriaceae bacterium]
MKKLLSTRLLSAAASLSLAAALLAAPAAPAQARAVWIPKVATDVKSHIFGTAALTRSVGWVTSSDGSYGGALIFNPSTSEGMPVTSFPDVKAYWLRDGKTPVGLNITTVTCSTAYSYCGYYGYTLYPREWEEIRVFFPIGTDWADAQYIKFNVGGIESIWAEFSPDRGWHDASWDPFPKSKTSTVAAPKKPGSVKLTVGKKQLKVSWKKPSGTITGYQVRYRLKGKSAWTKKSVKAKTLTIKKLKKGKKYQVSVRSYRTVDGTKYYSSWTSVKTSAKVK